MAHFHYILPIDSKQTSNMPTVETPRMNVFTFLRFRGQAGHPTPSLNYAMELYRFTRILPASEHSILLYCALELQAAFLRGQLVRTSGKVVRRCPYLNPIPYLQAELHWRSYV